MKSVNLLKDKCLVAEDEISSFVEKLSPFMNMLVDARNIPDYRDSLCFVNLPGDNNLYENVVRMVDRAGVKRLKYLFLVGIGGSSMGSQAVYDAFHGYFGSISPWVFPKIIVLDTIDPETNRFIETFVDRELSSPSDFAVVVVSKSGTTLETLTNAAIILGCLMSKFPNVFERTFAITDDGSAMCQWAKKNNVSVLGIPKFVGGRYSVFSSVGLFPLALAGIDVASFRDGAMRAYEDTVGAGVASDVAVGAAIAYKQYRNGKSIHDAFFFHPELSSLGAWQRQLIGESLGKEHEVNGVMIRDGITPTVSIGTKDLHSVAQLYFAGPRDKFTSFVMAETSSASAVVPEAPFMGGSHSGKDDSGILRSIYKGVTRAYGESGMPFIEYVLRDISEETIGYYMQLKMMETYLVAGLMGVNPFDQPAVEIYKRSVRKELENN